MRPLPRALGALPPARNHPSAERPLRLTRRWRSRTGAVSQPSFSREAVATGHRRWRGAPTNSQPSFSREAVATRRRWPGRCPIPRNHPSAERPLRPDAVAVAGAPAARNHPSAERPLRLVLRLARTPVQLATILQPRGRCDEVDFLRVLPVLPRNHPSAERPLRRHSRGTTRIRRHSQPSFSREAVATAPPEKGRASATRNHPSAERPLRLPCGELLRVHGRSQSSFSREAVATPWPARGRRGNRLAIILQPRGRCDATKLATSSTTSARNHPSAERPLRRDRFLLRPLLFGSQPSFSREAVATFLGCVVRRSSRLATILQPRGRCDFVLVVVGHTGVLATILQPRGRCDM